MKLTNMRIHLLWVAVVMSLGLVTIANGQMEKRSAEHYLTTEFLIAAPAVGSPLPEMTFQTLDGQEVELVSYVGKTIVLIKAGYT